jgi:hypothetical protein
MDLGSGELGQPKPTRMSYFIYTARVTADADCAAGVVEQLHAQV